MKRITTGAALLCCLLFATTVSAQKGKLRLLTYNIRNGKGMDGKTDMDRIAAVIKANGAPVVALQEVDSVTTRSGGTDVLQALAEKIGLHATYGGAIPYQGGRYGVGVLSKEAPRSHYTVPLPGREEQRVLLVVQFKGYTVFCTHLSLTPDDRLASLAIINTEAAKISGPIYLLGDFNAEPASPFLIGLKEGWTLLSGEAPTFPATTPNKCIDYIFCKNRSPKVKEATVIAEPVASDHRPVTVLIK